MIPQNKKVENQNTFSTNETQTGEFWIDGKPIYRKVVKITSLASDSMYKHKISNLNEVIRVYGMARFEGKVGSGWQPITRLVTDALEPYGLGVGDINTNVSSNQFLFQVGSSYTNFSKAYVIFEYTKK